MSVVGLFSCWAADFFLSPVCLCWIAFSASDNKQENIIDSKRCHSNNKFCISGATRCLKFFSRRSATRYKWSWAHTYTWEQEISFRNQTTKNSSSFDSFLFPLPAFSVAFVYHFCCATLSSCAVFIPNRQSFLTRECCLPLEIHVFFFFSFCDCCNTENVVHNGTNIVCFSLLSFEAEVNFKIFCIEICFTSFSTHLFLMSTMRTTSIYVHFFVESFWTIEIWGKSGWKTNENSRTYVVITKCWNRLGRNDAWNLWFFAFCLCFFSYKKMLYLRRVKIVHSNEPIGCVNDTERSTHLMCYTIEMVGNVKGLKLGFRRYLFISSFQNTPTFVVDIMCTFFEACHSWCRWPIRSIFLV